MRLTNRGDGERGVVLILTAFAMVAILIFAALVIDYGNVRSERQDSKLLTDTSATAGAAALAPGGIPLPWPAVCAALDYLKANRPDLNLSLTYMDGDGSPVAGNPCVDLAGQACLTGVEATWAWIQARDGTFVADIQSGYDLSTSGFPEDKEEYAGDDTEPPCHQLAVIIGKTNDAYFGGVADASSYETRIRSVVRVDIHRITEGVPAFLMLERKNCAVLWEQVGNQTNPPTLGIQVDPANSTNPGIIHVDSSGRGVGCDGRNGKDGWAVYASDNGLPTIVAQPSGDGTQPGLVSVHALEVGGCAVSFVPNGTPPAGGCGGTEPSQGAGVWPSPSPGGLISRKPVDKKYNSTLLIDTIHVEAYGDVTPGVTTPPASEGALANPDPTNTPWTIPACDDDGPITGSKIFLPCDIYSPNAVTFPDATDVIVTGRIAIGNNKSLFMPKAERVVVGGSGSSESIMVGGPNGRLGINSAVDFAPDNASTDAACAGRDLGPGHPGGTHMQTTKLVVFGGTSSKAALTVAGKAAMCQTFAYLAGPKTPTYQAQQIADGSYDPTCSPSLPCPTSTGITEGGNFDVTGYLRWSGPNQLEAEPPPGTQGIEDLALWTESSAPSSVSGGNGVFDIYGVYFLPNADAEIQGPTSTNPRDAQFIARTLGMLQGFFRMKPTPGNAVSIPILAGAGLIR